MKINPCKSNNVLLSLAKFDNDLFTQSQEAYSSASEVVNFINTYIRVEKCNFFRLQLCK